MTENKKWDKETLIETAQGYDNIARRHREGDSTIMSYSEARKIAFDARSLARDEYHDKQ